MLLRDVKAGQICYIIEPKATWWRTAFTGKISFSGMPMKRLGHGLKFVNDDDWKKTKDAMDKIVGNVAGINSGWGFDDSTIVALAEDGNMPPYYFT